MMGQRSAIYAAVALGAAALGLAGPSVALAQESSVLRDALFGSQKSSRRSEAPPVARYVSESGQGFVLDRTATRPLLRFESSSEVWVLHPQAAPRGDTIYKNDIGEPVLRATKVGGLTLFTPDRPEGTAVAVAGQSQPIRLAPMGPNTLLQRLAQASGRASRAAGRLIPFGADATPSSAALIADAAGLAAEAVAQVAARRGGKNALKDIRRIYIAQGRRPEAEVQDNVLVITVSPSQGLAGRPSSQRIARAAGH